MNTSTIIAIVVLLAILGLSIGYIYKHKKQGVKCIGCPYAGTCNHGCSNANSSVTKKAN